MTNSGRIGLSESEVHMTRRYTLRLIVTHCYDCPLGEGDRDICLHPSTGSRNPFNRDKKKVPGRCPLRSGNVSIRIKKETERRGKKKWTRQKLQQLLRLHEVEGLSLLVCARHFQVAATHLTSVLEEARSWRSKRWYGWTDMLEKKGK